MVLPSRNRSSCIVRMLAWAGLLGTLVGACAPQTPTASVHMIRRDGIEVECRPPARELLGSEHGIDVSVAIPDIVQQLLAPGGTDTQRAVFILRRVRNADALTVLEYRLCLEYGSGTLTPRAYTRWLEQVAPAVRTRLRR